MAEIVRITNLLTENNPCHILDKFRFQVYFESDKKLPYEVDWELIYIGSAKDQKYDQILEQFSTPVEQGPATFTLETNAPDLSKIPSTEDLLGVSAIIFSASYCQQEFFRLGFYTANHYTDPVLEQEPPQIPIIEKLQRSILADKPRITRFNINWSIDLNPVQTKQIQNTFQFDPFAKQTNIFEEQIQQPQIPFNHTMFSNEVSQPFPFNCNNNNNQQQQQQQFFQQQQQPQINQQYSQQQHIFQQQGFPNNQNNNFNNNNNNIYQNQQQQQFNQFQMQPQQQQQAVFQANNIFN